MFAVASATHRQHIQTRPPLEARPTRRARGPEDASERWECLSRRRSPPRVYGLNLPLRTRLATLRAPTHSDSLQSNVYRAHPSRSARATTSCRIEARRAASALRNPGRRWSTHPHTCLLLPQLSGTSPRVPSDQPRPDGTSARGRPVGRRIAHTLTHTRRHHHRRGSTCRWHGHLRHAHASPNWLRGRQGQHTPHLTGSAHLRCTPHAPSVGAAASRAHVELIRWLAWLRVQRGRPAPPWCG